MKMNAFTHKMVFIFSLMIITGCAEIHTIKAVPPIMNMEVVEIPSAGMVVSIEGDAEILKKEKTSGYQRVEIGTIASDSDILRLKPGCIAKIEFKDGSYILNKKQEEDVFITFELRNKKAPK